MPLILWASLWAHPQSAAHALSYLPLRRLYRSADAVVTYGPHVSAYVSARGARNVYVAPQSVDNDFWRAGGPPAPRAIPAGPARRSVRFLFVGRPAAEKGVPVLLDAWRAAQALPAADAALVLAGVEQRARRGASAICPTRPSCAWSARAAGAARRVRGVSTCWSCPRCATRTFREPWGLVVNEAMNRGLAVIATDAVGAAAGGLVRDGQQRPDRPRRRPPRPRRARSQRLAATAALRARLGAAGAQDVLAFSHDAWAEGFSRALSSLGVSRARW